MAGISEALVATGVGLFVALPAVVAYNAIQKKIGEVESNALSLTKLLTAYVRATDRAAYGVHAFESGARPLLESSEDWQNASDDLPSASTVKLAGATE
jgi:MotA/TolQ/ExbB proton channel family